jgi:phospholipid/cholesterol/gamma-HCH transport system substrate-binding protein
MKRQLKVGMFVLVALALCAAGVFLIGDARGLFESKTTYRTAFNDVAGLKPGAPVRMGGVDVGVVSSVGHATNPGDTRIYVTFGVNKAEAIRIREDTIARVANKGLLGDKMIELSVSDGRAPKLDPAMLMKSEDPQDMFAAANELAQHTQKVVERLDPLAERLGDPKFAEDIRAATQDLRQIMDAIAKNDSVAHKLLFDPEEGRKMSQLLTNLNNSTARLDGILGDVKDVTGHVKSGPGIAHAVVYDGDMSANAAGSLSEIHQDLEAIRKGNGIAHAVLYGDDPSQHLMANLNAMSDDLRQIVANVRQGKGTIGALLVDPSVYEDIKAAVGNVERNSVLRAIVRYSIKADEARPQVTTPPVPAPAAKK